MAERWIDNPGSNRYLVLFSKGSRQCLGINLAYAEMQMCLASMFCNSDREAGEKGVLELFEIGSGDVETQRDGFVPLASEGTLGFGVKVKSGE